MRVVNHFIDRSSAGRTDVRTQPMCTRRERAKWQQQGRHGGGGCGGGGSDDDDDDDDDRRWSVVARHTRHAIDCEGTKHTHTIRYNGTQTKKKHTTHTHTHTRHTRTQNAKRKNPPTQTCNNNERHVMAHALCTDGPSTRRRLK